MKEHVFKLRSVLSGQHVRTTIFANYVEEGGTLANCGVLTMTIGEWQVFGATLALGTNFTTAKVILEGDREIVEIIAASSGSAHGRCGGRQRRVSDDRTND